MIVLCSWEWLLSDKFGVSKVQRLFIGIDELPGHSDSAFDSKWSCWGQSSGWGHYSRQHGVTQTGTACPSIFLHFHALGAIKRWTPETNSALAKVKDCLREQNRGLGMTSYSFCQNRGYWAFSRDMEGTGRGWLGTQWSQESDNCKNTVQIGNVNIPHGFASSRLSK